MTTAIYTAKMFNETFSLRANFAEASSQIERQDEDGEWVATGWQVAQFTHRPELAMEAELEWNIEAGGDDPEEFRGEIESAIESMTRV